MILLLSEFKKKCHVLVRHPSLGLSSFFAIRRGPLSGLTSLQGLSQDLSCLSFGQVVSLKPVRTGKKFYEDFPILTFGG